MKYSARLEEIKFGDIVVRPGNPFIENVSPEVYGLETSGLLQKIRLNELFFAHQEQNWASHGWRVIQEKLILEVRALVEKNNFAAFTTLSW